jgi:hypothetical protein
MQAAKGCYLKPRDFFGKEEEASWTFKRNIFLSRSFVAILDFQVVVKVSMAEICELNKFNYLCYALIYFIF